MLIYHVWTSNAHDLFCFASHFWFVAMNFAVFTIRFFFTKRAFVESKMSIIPHLFAVGAQSNFGLVLLSAIDAQHFAEGNFFGLDEIHYSSLPLRFCTLW